MEFDFDIRPEYLFPFILFLTNKQINEYDYYKEMKENYQLVMSNTQFHKTCFATILLSRDIHHYIKYEVLPPPPKIKRNAPLLAIEMKNLIDFDEDPTPPVEKDLIPVSKEKPDLIPVKKTQNKIDQIIEKKFNRFHQRSIQKLYPKSKF